MSTLSSGSISGRRAVLVIYAVIVALAAVFGAVVGLVIPGKENAPEMAGYGPFVFEVTPLNFAIYGAVNVGLLLGVLLLLMAAVSKKYPDA